jgi:signal transduction histidine kinase
VKIEVRDDGPGFTPEALIAGHGLDNLQARLIALFDADARLDLCVQDGFMIVTISLPGKQSRTVTV